MLRPRERDNNNNSCPLVVTWMGDTHKETNVLPVNKLETRGGDEQDVILDKEKSTWELTLMGEELLAQSQSFR